MTKINEIFPDSNEITISDIDDLKDSGILHENHEIEFTDIDKYITKKSKTGKKEQKLKQNRKIVSELISFLNSGRGVGLLILGLAEIDDKIVKKSVNTLKTKEQIRSIIYSNIGSIPSKIKNFKLDIIPIEYNNGNIFIIGVENNDLDCIFYSKIDNIAYERQGDECTSINLPDFLEVLAHKNHARVFTEFKEKTISDDSYSFKILLNNEGLEPGIYVTTKMIISTVEEVIYSIDGGIKKTLDNVMEINNNKVIKNGKIVGDTTSGQLTYEAYKNATILKGNKILESVFFGAAGYPPTTLLVYPGLPPVMGTLTIEKKDFEMFIHVLNYEKRGSTKQEFFIKSKHDEIDILETQRTFKPYLKL